MEAESMGTVRAGGRWGQRPSSKNRVHRRHLRAKKFPESAAIDDFAGRKIMTTGNGSWLEMVFAV
jgi:hypothetical protein